MPLVSVSLSEANGLFGRLFLGLKGITSSLGLSRGKILDLDGFTFSFMKKYSELNEKGCNTTFYTLIPKVTSPMIGTNNRSTSLNGVQYNVNAKLLEYRLIVVISTIDSMEQFIFVK